MFETRPSKVPYVASLLSDPSQVAFALTETWLTPDHEEAEITVPGFAPFRADRKQRAKAKRGSGGVALYLRDNLAITAEKVFEYSCGVIEAVGVHIPTLNLRIFVVYRPGDRRPDPSSTAVNARNRGEFRSTAKELKAFLRKLEENLSTMPAPTPDVMLMGDINLPHADWKSGECKAGATDDEQTMVKDLYEFALSHFMVQQIEGSTHEAGNLLDLIFTNNHQLVHDFSSTPSTVSDHYVVEVSAHYKSNTCELENESENQDPDQPPTLRDYNFFHEDAKWPEMKAAMDECNWEDEFRDLEATEMLDKFVNFITSLAAKYVPLRKKPSAKSDNIPRDRRILMLKRTRAKKQLKTATGARAEALNLRLISIELELQKSYRQQSNREETKAISNIKRNPKSFYSYANKFSKVSTAIGPLINSAKKLVTSASQMAEILSQQYQSVFSQPKYPDTDANDLFPDEEGEDLLSNIEADDKDFEDAIDELSATSAAGPDGIPAILLKYCKKCLSKPIAMIWRASMQQGNIPHVCKTANIIPIHKGKSRAVPANYRPVALTSHLIKLFEKVVRKKIVAHLEKHNLLNPTQHGFRQGRSCLSQLISHFDKITTLLENQHAVDVIYLDFAKAFDKVDIGVTMRKLHALNIRGRLGRWLADFLTGREQCVIVNGKKSGMQPVISGVPQGSVLGPLIFLVLIGDIDKEVVQAFLSSFADDTRVGLGIDTDEDVDLLQQDLERVYTWSETNNMQFNGDKFEALRYTNKSTPGDRKGYTSNTGAAIKEKASLTDLGVIMSNDASFTKHITSVVQRVTKKSGWALRTFNARDRTTMLTLWKSLILPHHDYCSQLWSPLKTGLIQKLELLQRSFFRKIHGMRQLSYWEQLIALRARSLERRRERYMIIYVWRILEGQVPNLNSTVIETTSDATSRIGRLCHVPHVSNQAPAFVKKARDASLPIRGVKLFNAIPKELRNITGCKTDSFKAALDRFLATIPDEPLIPGYTAGRRCSTNSIIEWVQTLQRQQDLVQPTMHGQDGEAAPQRDL